MARARHKDELQVGDDLAHQRRQWRAERIAWVAIAFLLVAACAGVFGYGPLSRTHAGAPGGMTVEYDRLQRSSAPSDWAFDIDASLVRDGTVQLRIDNTLLDDVELDSIVPEPEQVEAGQGGTRFVFNVVPGHDAHIVFRFRPATFGRRTGRVAASGAAPIVLDQFVYP